MSSLWGTALNFKARMDQFLSSAHNRFLILTFIETPDNHLKPSILWQNLYDPLTYSCIGWTGTHTVGFQQIQ